MEIYSKEVQIMRQSQIKLALDFVNSHKIDVSLEILLGITDILVQSSLMPVDDELRNRIRKLDEWILKQKK